MQRWLFAALALVLLGGCFFGMNGGVYRTGGDVPSATASQLSFSAGFYLDPARLIKLSAGPDGQLGSLGGAKTRELGVSTRADLTIVGTFHNRLRVTGAASFGQWGDARRSDDTMGEITSRGYFAGATWETTRAPTNHSMSVSLGPAWYSTTGFLGDASRTGAELRLWYEIKPGSDVYWTNIVFGVLNPFGAVVSGFQTVAKNAPTGGGASSIPSRVADPVSVESCSTTTTCSVTGCRSTQTCRRI